MLVQQIKIVNKKKVLVDFIQTDPHFQFVIASFTKDHRYLIDPTKSIKPDICIIKIQTLLKYIHQKNNLRFLNKKKQESQFWLPCELVLNDLLINSCRIQQAKIGKVFLNKQLIGFSDLKVLQVLELERMGNEYKANKILPWIKIRYDLLFFNFHYQYLNISYYNGQMLFINCYQNLPINKQIRKYNGAFNCDSTPNQDEYLRLVFEKQRLNHSKNINIQHVYQAFDGELLANGYIVSRQFKQPIFQNALEQITYHAQLGGQTFSPIKYKISPCENYLFGKLGKYQNWIVRSRLIDWEYLFQWEQKPYFYPFTSKLHETVQAFIIKYIDQKFGVRPNFIPDNIQIVIIASFQKSVVKVTILQIIKQGRKKKVVRLQNQEEQQYKIYDMKQHEIVSVKIDQQILKLRWVGPESIMAITKTGQLIYLQKLTDRIAETYYKILQDRMKPQWLTENRSSSASDSSSYLM